MGAYDDLLADVPAKKSGAYDDLLSEVDKPETSLKDKIYKAANKLFQPSSVIDEANISTQPTGFDNTGAFERVIQNNTVPNNLQAGSKIVDGLTGIAEVGGRKGYAGLGRIEAGAIKALADVLGSETLSNIAKSQQDYANQVENGAVLSGKPIEGFAKESIVQDLPGASANAISSIITTAPSLAAGAIAPGLTFPAMFSAAGSQEYGQGRESGLNPAGAVMRAMPQAALEVIGEKVGGTGRLAEALHAAAKGNGLANLGSAMVGSAIKELPGEELTATGNFLVDKAPGIGLNQEAGISDYGKQVKDTALATLLQSGAMAGGGHVLNTIAGSTQSAPVINEVAPEVAQNNQFDATATLDALNQAKELVKPRLEISRGTQADDALAAQKQAEHDAQTTRATPTYDDLLADVDKGATNEQPIANAAVGNGAAESQSDNVDRGAGTELLAQPAEPNNAEENTQGGAGDIPAPVADKPNRTLKQKSGTLLATLRDLGGVSISDKLDVVGEDKGFAPGGYNQIFRNNSRQSLKGHIESGTLDDYLPPAMRLSSQTQNSDAFDSTEAYDYLADKIRNGERVLKFDVEQEVKANKFYQDDSADVQSDIINDVLSDDEVNALLSEAGHDEREANTQAQIFEQRESDSDIAGNEGIQTREGAGRGGQTQADEVTRSEVSGARDVITQIVKRRAAANQIGKSKPFDTALQLAKDFMNGEKVSPIKFKNAAILFKNDAPLSEAFNKLHEQAKAPAREHRAARNDAVDAYTRIIEQAESAKELHQIAGDIQDDKSLTDAQAQALDDAVMQAIDAMDSKEANNADLLGDNTVAKQAIADAERAKDAKRNAGTDNQEAFTLTGSNSEADQAAAAGAQALQFNNKEVIWLKSSDIGIDSTSIEDIRQAAIKLAKDKFAGNTIRNISDGTDIIIGNQGIKHAMSGKVSNVSAMAMTKLDEIVRKAKFVRSEPDKAGRNTIKEVRFYQANVSLDGKDSTLEMVVRVAHDGHRYYDHFEITNPAGQSGKPDNQVLRQPFTGLVSNNDNETIRPSNSESNVDDFGEKLEGARKGGDQDYNLRQDMEGYNAYETDIFGNPIQDRGARPNGRQAAATDARAGALHKTGHKDTIAPEAEYYVNTIVGSEVNKELGASIVKSSQQAAQATRYLNKSAVERLDGVVTDKNGKPLAVIGGFKGAVGSTSAPPSTLVAEAVRIPGAANLWLSHNHPSGKAELSAADKSLYRHLKDIFDGTGIDVKGLIAVARDEYAAIDNEGESQLLHIPESSSRLIVPVIERNLKDEGFRGGIITMPNEAKVLSRAFHERAKQNGIMLLDSQSQISAWLPLSDALIGNLKNTGALNSLYRAISQSNAAGAIIAHDGSLSEPKFPNGQDVIKNIGKALANIDVGLLDAIDVNKNTSYAERNQALIGSVLFSRSATTQQKYEQRIDELFNGAKADFKGTGAMVLDSSDMLGLLGYNDKPIYLTENKVIQGQENHPKITADIWKKIPEWLENPAMVFDSDTSSGRLVFIPSETIEGYDLRIIVDPDAEAGGLKVNLLLNAYDVNKTPYKRWINDGLLRYYNKRESPVILARSERQLPSMAQARGFKSRDFLTTSRLQLPRVLQEARSSGRRILVDSDLVKYRAENNAKLSRDTTKQNGMPKADVQSIVDDLTAKWRNAPQIIVVDDMNDTAIREAVRAENERQLSQGAEGQPEGFFDAGKVYVVASEMATAADVQRVIFHEALGHFGLQGTFGNALNDVLDKLYELRRADVLKKVKQYGLDLTNQKDRRIAAEEVLAEMAQNNPEIGFVKRAIAAIRQWLRDNGFNVKLSDNDIVANYLLPARDFVQRGKQENTASGMVTAFSRAEDAKKPVTVDSRDNWLFRRDALGNIQLAPTGKAYDFISNITQNIANQANFGMASPELRKQIRHFKADMQKALDVAGNVAHGMQKMTPEDRALVSDVVENMLKTGTVPPRHVLDVAANMQSIMDTQTDELVKLGMLSQESAARWRGKYLPRFYNRAQDPALDTLAKKRLRTALPVRGMGGGSLKGRGLYKEINVRELDNWEALGWEVRDTLWKKNRQGKLELIDTNNVRENETVMIWRDYTPAERESMGENRDAMFRFVMGYTAMQNDIALGRLFDGIASNQEWTRSRPSEGYTKVPDSEIAETGGVKRYGNLAGLYVRDDIMQHISQYEQSSDLVKYYRKALSFWKAGKTVLNPVSHMNNMVSNLTMAHFAGVSYWETHKYIGAIRDFVNNAPMIQEAKDVGLMTGDITRAELMADMPNDIKAMMNSQDSKITKNAKATYNVLTLWLTKPMSKAYRFEDDFFKYLIYKEARGKGVSPDDAVDYATKYIFNYDDLPKTARLVRDAAIPFFAYTYKAVPALAYTAFNYPWRFAAPAAAIYGLNALAYGLIAGDDDDDLAERFAKGKELETEERKNLPPWMQGKSALGTEKTIRLGTDNKTGLPIYMDISRFMPGGDVFDVAHGEFTTLPAPITPSNPVLTTIAALMPQINKDMFTGKDVIDKNDTPTEAAKKRAGWLVKQISPAIAPTGYHAEKLLNAGALMADTTINIPFVGFGDDVEYTGFGKDGLPVQPKYAAMNVLGIKAKPIDLEFSAEISQGQDFSEIRSIDAEIGRAAGLLDKGAISQRAYDKIEKEGNQKIEDIENKNNRME